MMEPPSKQSDHRGNETIAPDPISFDDVLARARAMYSSQNDEDGQVTRAFLLESEAKKLDVDLYGRKQFLDLQKSWAGQIKWQIWAVLGFQFLFVACIGFNPWGFTDNIMKLPYMYVGVILQSLANIIALGLVVANFLFPKQPSAK